MAIETYTPTKADAQGLSRVFPNVMEEDQAAHDPFYGSAKFIGKPIMDEILALISNMYTTGTTQRLTGKNRLINGDFSIAQRGTSFTSTTTPANNDDTYLLDRWYMLTDGNDIFDVTQQLANDAYEIRLDVETINKKGGIAQIIEYRNCKDLIGKTVNLSFKMKVSSTTKLDNIKCAIVAWSGTADTVTSDIISAWGVEGTNPTLIANATYENTPANLVPTTSYATYSVSAAFDTASAKNLIIFIWSDVTDTTLGDFIYIKDVQLEEGAIATPFEFRLFPKELALCQRYYEKSYDVDVAPGTSTVGGLLYGVGRAGSATQMDPTMPIWFKVGKRTNSYTMTAYRDNGTSGSWVFNGTGDTVNFYRPSTQCVMTYSASGLSGLSTGTSYICQGHWTCDNEL